MLASITVGDWYSIINRSFATKEDHLEVDLKTEVHTAAVSERGSAILTNTDETLNRKPDVYHSTSVQHGAMKLRLASYDSATS